MSDKIHQLYGGKIEIKFLESNHSYWTTFLSELKKDGTAKLRRLTGVTSFIGIIDKPALIPWAVNTTVKYIREHLDELKKEPKEILKAAREESDKQRDISAEIGKAIHAWVEKHINGQEPEMPEDEKVLQGVVNFLDWIAHRKVEFVASEQIVYSKEHDFVGTLDILAKVDKKLCLIDIKTGNGIYAEAKMQTAAYRKAWEEECGKKLSGRWIWRISKETEEQYIGRMQEKEKTDFDPFQAFEAVYLDNDSTTQERDYDGFLAAQKLYRWKAGAEKELRT
ncbi:MAG: PD-(D/E)XK nuclease family protein [Patescibacteria group bacterium]|mgnify:CR=1 FL=1